MSGKEIAIAILVGVTIGIVSLVPWFHGKYKEWKRGRNLRKAMLNWLEWSKKEEWNNLI